jgi:hypothetical protein
MANRKLFSRHQKACTWKLIRGRLLLANKAGAYQRGAPFGIPLTALPASVRLARIKLLFKTLQLILHECQKNSF